MSTESNHHSESRDGVICPKCLLSNSTTAAFCVDCGAPIGMVAMIDPIQHIYAEGFGYRAAVDGPPKRIILVGMWLTFGPAALLGPSLLIGGAWSPVIEAIAFNLVSACAVVVLFRTTKNYIVKTRAAHARNPAPLGS